MPTKPTINDFLIIFPHFTKIQLRNFVFGKSRNITAEDRISDVGHSNKSCVVLQNTQLILLADFLKIRF